MFSIFINKDYLISWYGLSLFFSQQEEHLHRHSQQSLNGTHVDFQMHLITERTINNTITIMTAIAILTFLSSRSIAGNINILTS